MRRHPAASGESTSTDVMELLLKSKKEEESNCTAATIVKGYHCPVTKTAAGKKLRQEQEQQQGCVVTTEVAEQPVVVTEMVEVDEQRAIKFCQPLTNSYETLGQIDKTSSMSSTTQENIQQQQTTNNRKTAPCAPAAAAASNCFCGHCCYVDGCGGHVACNEEGDAGKKKKSAGDRKAKKILTCIITSMCLMMDCLLGLALGAYFILGISVICCL